MTAIESNRQYPKLYKQAFQRGALCAQKIVEAASLPAREANPFSTAIQDIAPPSWMTFICLARFCNHLAIVVSRQPERFTDPVTSFYASAYRWHFLHG